MNTEKLNKGFVSVPYLADLSDKKLYYKDILIYTAIKSFKNSDTNVCFPSHESIAKRAGCSRNFVRASILRLEKSGMMQIHRPCCPRKPTNYTFPHLEVFNRIPVGIFDTDLTVNERAMLICMVQFFMTLGKRHYKWITDKAACLGLSYISVYKQCNALVKKGYIKEEIVQLRKSTKTRHYYELVDKLEWHYPQPKFLHDLEVEGDIKKPSLVISI